MSILFADIVEFTKLSAKMAPDELIELLNNVFSEFDDLADQFGLEKIKTIGDSYMVVAGLPEECVDHATIAAKMGLAMLDTIKNLENVHKLRLRIGICSGSVIAGVIGKKKFAFDLWGDSVNTAARMESSGVVSEIQVTDSTYQLLKKRLLFSAPRNY